jgi:pilus assembly protein CpaE
MKDAIRIVLIDPNAETRQHLQRLLGEVGEACVAEVCAAYQGAVRRVSEIRPDLAIVVLDHDPKQGVGLLQTILQNSPEVVVLPASRARDSSTILSAIRAGAREFLTLPSGVEELRESFSRLIVRREEPPAAGASRGPQVVAVTAAAGGVGCTSVAVNLATALAKGASHEVVLVDFDLMLGSVDACLDLMPDGSLHDVVQNIDRLDLTLLKRSLTRHASSGLYVLPHPAAMEDAAKLDPEVLRRVIALLRSAFPSVVIDTSKGLQSSDFVAFEAADLIVMVVQLDLTCLRNTARLLHLFEEFDGLGDRVRLVANRVGSHDSEISLKKAEETLRKPISWQVPNATKVFHAARAKGVPIDAVGPGGRAHQAILEVARAVRPFPTVEEAKKPRKGLFAALF